MAVASDAGSREVDRRANSIRIQWAESGSSQVAERSDSRRASSPNRCSDRSNMSSVTCCTSGTLQIDTRCIGKLVTHSAHRLGPNNSVVQQVSMRKPARAVPLVLSPAKCSDQTRHHKQQCLDLE